MELFLKMILMGLMLLTLGFLMLGILKIGKSGEQVKSNLIMNWRVWTQALAFLVVTILLYIKR